jgi:hypothetical protein
MSLGLIQVGFIPFTTTPVGPSYLLQEINDKILLEDGFGILLE